MFIHMGCGQLTHLLQKVQKMYWIIESYKQV